jgi:hypothetical protein
MPVGSKTPTSIVCFGCQLQLEESPRLQLPRNGSRLRLEDKLCDTCRVSPLRIPRSRVVGVEFPELQANKDFRGLNNILGSKGGGSKLDPWFRKDEENCPTGATDAANDTDATAAAAAPAAAPAAAYRPGPDYYYVNSSKCLKEGMGGQTRRCSVVVLRDFDEQAITAAGWFRARWAPRNIPDSCFDSDDLLLYYRRKFDRFILLTSSQELSEADDGAAAATDGPAASGGVAAGAGAAAGGGATGGEVVVAGGAAIGARTSRRRKADAEPAETPNATRPTIDVARAIDAAVTFSDDPAMEAASAEDLRALIEASRKSLARKEEATAQSRGQACGRGSTHRQHTCLLTKTCPRQGSSSGTADESAFRSLSSSEPVYDSMSAADDEPVHNSMSAADEPAAIRPEMEVEEIYALLDQADENLEDGALWAVELGLQRAMKLLGIKR